MPHQQQKRFTNRRRAWLSNSWIRWSWTTEPSWSAHYATAVSASWLNPYPGKWGSKMTPSPLLPLYLDQNCKIYGHALFGILSRTPRAIYRHINFCHISTRNEDMMVWNRKYILGNQRKVECPIVNLMITSNKHFHRLLLYFHGYMAWTYTVGMVSWCQYSLLSVTPKRVLSLEIYRYLFPVWSYNYFRFRAWPWRYLSYLTSCSTWCRFSFHWVYGHLTSLTGY